MPKTKKTKKNFLKKNKKYIFPGLLSFILFILIIATYQVLISERFYPFTFVGDTNISFLTKGQSIQKLQSKFNKRSGDKLQFNYDQKSYEVDISTSSARLDYFAFDSNFSQTHSGSVINILQDQFQTLILTSRIHPKIILFLTEQMDNIAATVDKPPQDAQLTFDETPIATDSARIQIKEGVNGLTLDRNEMENQVSQYLLAGKYQNELPIKNVLPRITTERVIRAKRALEQTIKQPIKLIFEKTNWFLDTKQLLTLLDLTSEKDFPPDADQSMAGLLDKEKTYIYLEKIASEINQEVQEGLFDFNPDTKRVTAFKPSQEGRKLDIEKTYQALTYTLVSGKEKSINLPINITKPKIQTSDVNSLGINELLGRGISHFAGSIQNRIYNVNLTASKINGTLVPPGEIFSFNQTVGDITAATGFKQAYVIKSGRTVLDDGGGVCQDSTTLFRAVLNAGLPVTKRTAHAYRVGYYEQGFPAGLDATVFYPTVDFQFKNDTPAHILIQAYTSGLTLYTDLYGTSDGRVSIISKSIITNQTPPPPELRQDDPTLPKGEVKQVDWAAWGANVSFTRTVTRNGEEIIKETWKSAYKPWQAVYLVGTKE